MTDSSMARLEEPAACDEELRSQYRAIVGAQTVRRQGLSVPLLRLRPDLESPERRRRERAWRLASRRRLEDAPVLSELWQSLVAIRVEVASEAGASSYPALRRQQLGEAVSLPDAGRRTQLAVEEFVTSVLVRLHERRRLQLGLRTIRPWDLFTVPPGFPVDPLFATKCDVHAAVERALSCARYRAAVLSAAEAQPESLESDEEVEELLAHYGEAVAREEISGPAGGGAAVRDLGRIALPLLVLHGTEEAHSEKHTPTSLNRVRIRHLERRLLHWTFGAMIDAFEEWIYSYPEQVQDEDVAGAIWSSLWLRFLPAVDWSGLEDVLKVDWQHHDALFLRTGESLIRISRELQVFIARSQGPGFRAWFQGSGLTEQTEGHPLLGAASISDQDLLDVARWMEDTIEGLEGAI